MQLGRNEPCYCGSGKKYKKCCLSNGRSAGTADEPHSSRNEVDILDRAIPPAVIQAVMEEIDGWSSDQFERLANKLTKKHTVLLAFVATVLSSMPAAARDQSLLTVFALIRMFETHYGSNYKPIVEADVTHMLNRNGRLLVDTANGVLAQNPGDVVQPYVLQFVADAFDFEEDEMPNEHDAFSMLMVLKTTVDLLDRAYAASRKPAKFALAAHA